MRTALAIALLLVLAAGSDAAWASTAPSPQEAGERRALAQLLVSPRENPLRECAIMALRDNSGLMAYRIARAGDAAVRAGLTASDDPADRDLEHLRDAQMATWAASHSPGPVANQEFQYCQQHQLVRSTLPDAESSCFNVLAAPAMAEVLKKVQHDRAKTREEVLKAFAGTLPAPFLAQVVADVYASDPDANDYLVHRQVLATCILHYRR